MPPADPGLSARAPLEGVELDGLGLELEGLRLDLEGLSIPARARGG